MNIYKHKRLLQRTIIATVFIILFNLISPVMMLVSKAFDENYANSSGIMASQGYTKYTLPTMLKQWGMTTSASTIINALNSSDSYTFTETTDDGTKRYTFRARKKDLGNDVVTYRLTQVGSPETLENKADRYSDKAKNFDGKKYTTDRELQAALTEMRNYNKIKKFYLEKE